MDSSEPSFGQDGSPRVLPVTTPEEDGSLTSQNIPGPLTQAQTLSAEQFHLVDQNGQKYHPSWSLRSGQVDR